MSEDLKDFLDSLEDSSVDSSVDSSDEQVKYLLNLLKSSPEYDSIAGVILKLESDISENFKEISNIKQYNDGFLIIYKILFFKYLDNPDDKLLLLFLRFSHISDFLINKETKSFIENGLLPDETSETSTIISFCYWLELIFEGRENPSLSEMGVDYSKHSRDKHARMSRKERERAGKISDNEENQDKVIYELNNMAKTVMKMMQANPETNPYLLSQPFLGRINHSFVSFSKIKELIEELKQIDFSVFYREVVYRHDNTNTEIIHKEIEPYFIIMPTCGDKIVFWQEISENKKGSRGRIFVPAFFIGDFRSSMIEALGAFRWELCRSSKGARWIDPIDGGITGLFYDYITFYKKNSKLSFEAKEKLENTIKNFRKNPKKVFVYFYKIWMESESKGVMRLDKMCRGIFFKHVPFSMSIRERLKRIPIYGDLGNKYNNVAEKNISRLEIRYRNKVDEHGKLPEELEGNLTFYRS